LAGLQRAAGRAAAAHDRRYEPLFSSVWADQRLADRLGRSVVARLPRPAEAMSTSLWLLKR